MPKQQEHQGSQQAALAYSMSVTISEKLLGERSTAYVSLAFYLHHLLKANVRVNPIKASNIQNKLFYYKCSCLLPHIFLVPTPYHYTFQDPPRLWSEKYLKYYQSTIKTSQEQYRYRLLFCQEYDSIGCDT